MSKNTETDLAQIKAELEQLKAELTAAKAANDQLQADLEQDRAKAEQLDKLNELLASPAGIAAFEAELGKAKVEMGIAPTTTPPEPKDLDTSMFTDEGLQIVQWGRDLEQRIFKGIDELKGVVNNIANRSETERLANVGTARVREELGLDLTPQQLSKAMLDTNESDPIKAVFKAMPDQAIASVKKLTATPVEKPNHATSVQELDIDKMTTAERYNFLKNNPAIADQLAQQMFGAKTEQAPEAPETTE